MRAEHTGIMDTTIDWKMKGLKRIFEFQTLPYYISGNLLYLTNSILTWILTLLVLFIRTLSSQKWENYGYNDEKHEIFKLSASTG